MTLGHHGCDDRPMSAEAAHYATVMEALHGQRAAEQGGARCTAGRGDVLGGAR